VTVDTKALNPGTYTVKGHVEEGKKPGQFADCSATVTVTQFQPPTVSCSANPTTVNLNEPATITANGVSPQNRPLTYSYSSTAGNISGNTSTATLTTTGVAPGTVTVTANVVDDKGQTASCQTTVTVNAPPPVVKPTTKDLCSISFDRDAKRPTRVDNEAKACLDDIALSAQQDPNAKLAVVGSAASDEKNANNAAQRAVNEKDYLVTEKGIDASRISVYTGTAGTKSSATTLIPDGATLDTTGLTAVDESAVKPVSRTAPAPKKHRRKK
jgi:outer membrane protein OmpA-like peptidoglycan-associated protein